METRLFPVKVIRNLFQFVFCDADFDQIFKYVERGTFRR